MGKAKYYISLLTIFTSFVSCEDVIDVDVETTESRLIVNGLLRVDFNEVFVPVEIRISETTNFFEENVPVQLDDNALIMYGQPREDAPELFDNLAFSSLAEVEPGSGIYVPDPTFDRDQRIQTKDILPNTVFFLFVEHKGKRYAARTPFSTAVPIDNLEQGDETLFDEDDLEIKITITDMADSENHYVFDFGNGEFLALDDQFIDGQEFEFSYFLEQNIQSGDQLEVGILGADQEFYNYMDLLIEQTEDTGGVFQTPAATVRGNVFDVTGLDNDEIFDNVGRPESFALGYFAVVEEYKATMIIE